MIEHRYHRIAEYNRACSKMVHTEQCVNDYMGAQRKKKKRRTRAQLLILNGGDSVEHSRTEYTLPKTDTSSTAEWGSVEQSGGVRHILSAEEPRTPARKVSTAPRGVALVPEAVVVRPQAHFSAEHSAVPGSIAHVCTRQGAREHLEQKRGTTSESR